MIKRLFALIVLCCLAVPGPKLRASSYPCPSESGMNGSCCAGYPMRYCGCSCPEGSGKGCVNMRTPRCSRYPIP